MFVFINEIMDEKNILVLLIKRINQKMILKDNLHMFCKKDVLNNYNCVLIIIGGW